MEFHPLADEFPLLEGEAFDQLVKSIEREGLLEPIMVCEHKILDGRNRYRACLKAGVEPRFEDFDVGAVSAWINFVAAKNLTRRHLSDGQRAMIAARLTNIAGMTPQQAAAAMNVKSRNAQKATVIQRVGSPNVVDLVQRGKMSVNRAHEVATGRRDGAEQADDRRRTGRPVGDTHVNALRNTLADLERLYDYEAKIANKWPGDPDLNIRLSKAHAYLGALLRRTRESDQDGVPHAAARA
jgi:hypothetical protein